MLDVQQSEGFCGEGPFSTGESKTALGTDTQRGISA